ncbi:hypothetical protein TNCV_1944501 [Trichonephila clavipes]|nr:hypothetical protein TNCV_1944501 [Trichonephila clavipes]
MTVDLNWRFSYYVPNEYPNLHTRTKAICRYIMQVRDSGDLFRALRHIHCHPITARRTGTRLKNGIVTLLYPSLPFGQQESPYLSMLSCRFTPRRAHTLAANYFGW